MIGIHLRGSVNPALLISILYMLTPLNPRASLIAQLVKNLPATQETLIRFLGWEDPLEKG